MTTKFKEYVVVKIWIHKEKYFVELQSVQESHSPYLHALFIEATKILAKWLVVM